MKPQKIEKDAPNFCQIGEISSNLVTLASRKNAKCQLAEERKTNSEHLRPVLIENTITNKLRLRMGMGTPSCKTS